MSDVQDTVVKGKNKDGEKCVWHVTIYLRNGNYIGYILK